MALSAEEKRELLEELKKELMESKKVFVSTCREGVELPQYANIGDAGMDIRSQEEIILIPGETKIIPTGIKVAIPEGYELQVRPRSGLSLKTPLRIANTPGTIDSGYRDEIGIIMTNSSHVLQYDFMEPECCFSDSYGNESYKRECFIRAQNNKTSGWNGFNVELNVEPYTIDEKGNKQGIYKIRIGDRIAQIVLVKYETIEFEQVEDVKTIGFNRRGGFGSTGTK